MRHITMLALVLAGLSGPVLAQEFKPAEFKANSKALLDKLSNVTLSANQRAEAAEQLAHNVATATQRTEMARLLAESDMVPAYFKSKDAVSQLLLAKLSAQIHHLHFLDILQAALTSQDPAVRYWAAKGLGEAMPDMFELGGRKFFEDPVKALVTQGQKETSPLVVEQIYKALGRVSRMTSLPKNMTLYKAFMTLFTDRVKRLNAGKVQGVSAETAGIEVSLQWEAFFRQDKPVRTNILFQQAQLLKWATDTYVAQWDQLTTDRKAELERVIVRGAQALSNEVKEPTFFQEVNAQLSDRLMLQLRVLNFVGDPGLEGTLQKYGVPAPAPLAGPATQPDNARP